MPNPTKNAHDYATARLHNNTATELELAFLSSCATNNAYREAWTPILRDDSLRLRRNAVLVDLYTDWKSHHLTAQPTPKELGELIGKTEQYILRELDKLGARPLAQKQKVYTHKSDDGVTHTIEYEYGDILLTASPPNKDDEWIQALVIPAHLIIWARDAICKLAARRTSDDELAGQLR